MFGEVQNLQRFRLLLIHDVLFIQCEHGDRSHSWELADSRQVSLDHSLGTAIGYAETDFLLFGALTMAGVTFVFGVVAVRSLDFLSD